VYINGIVGAEHYLPEEGLDENRTMNRQVFELDALQQSVSQSESIGNQVLAGMKTLFAKRALEPAFNPNNAPVDAFDCGNDSVLTARVPGGTAELLVAANLSSTIQQVLLDNNATSYQDQLSEYTVEKGTNLSLAPYQTCWLKPE
jgi:hypothetical protein